MSRVYVSLPLSGPNGAAGREVLRGVELANNGGFEVVARDAFGDDRDALAATHARQAIEDPHALACIGGFTPRRSWPRRPCSPARGWR